MSPFSRLCAALDPRGVLGMKERCHRSLRGAVDNLIALLTARGEEVRSRLQGLYQVRDLPVAALKKVWLQGEKPFNRAG
jgi:hypothetical protein